MIIEDDIINAAAKQMAKDIDDELLMTMTGWHKLEIGEGRVYGARYLTVKPEGYTPNWDNQIWNKMVEWCVETYGPTAHDGVWTPSMRWYVNNAKFWFRNEKDLNWFVLRWSS